MLKAASIVLGLALAPALAAPAKVAPSTVMERPLELVRLEFPVETNVKAFRFKGEASEMKGTFAVQGESLKALRVSIPVKALTTHMSLRDAHMKERIFTRPDGSAPDVTFVGQKFDCKPQGATTRCQITGEFTLRGEKRTITFPTQVDRKPDGTAVATGTMEIRLSDFGVEAPAHMGVKVADPVKVEFEVKGRP